MARRRDQPLDADEGGQGVVDDPPTPLPQPEAWHALAACRDTATDLFISEPGGRKNDPASKLPTVGRAQRVCSRCPVRRPCLRSALVTEKSLAYGVWGGVSARDRNATRHLPLQERLDMLEQRFLEQAPKWLLPNEEIVT